MSTTDPPTFTVPSPIGDLTITPDAVDAVRVDLAGARVNGVDYQGTAYVHHVHPDQLQGRHGDGPPAWIVGSFRNGELWRYDGLYLRRAGSWDDPTPAATKKVRAVVEEAVTAWAATGDGADALSTAGIRALEHVRAQAAEKARELRELADMIEDVARVVTGPSAYADAPASMLMGYRDAHRVKDARPGFVLDFWQDGAGDIRATLHGARVPADWRTPQGLVR